jgi:hypothetical protein
LQINKVDGFGKSKKVVDMPKSIILVMPDGSKALTRKEVEIAELKKQNETRKIKAERYRRIAYFSILQSEDCKDNPEKHKTKGLGNYPFGNFNQFMTKWHCQHDKNYPNYVSWQRTSIYNNGKRAQIPRPRTCSHKVLNWVESQKRRDKIRNGLLDIKSERFATNNDTEIEKPRVKSEFLK